MTAEIRSFEDLVRLLRERPEWREELRLLLLTQELLELPRVVRELVDAVARLAEGQQALAERMERYEEIQQRMLERMERYEETQAGILEIQQRMLETQRWLADRVGGLRGWALESRYRTHAYAYFGRLLRRTQVVDQLPDELRKRLSNERFDDLLLADLFLTGELIEKKKRLKVWIVLEVSGRVERSDVERAGRRAGHLRAAGYLAVGGAAGEEVMGEAKDAAQELKVIVVEDGRVEGWEEALQAALGG